MKNPINRASIAVPLSFLLALLLIVSISSCSRPNLADIVREHIEAVNNDDVEKNLTLFTEDGVFEPDAATKLSGKAQVRNLMEWDVVNNARLSIKDLKVKGNTVIAELTEKNEGWRLLGIDIPFTATYEFRDRYIRRVKLVFSPDSWKIFEDKFEPFAEWAKRAHPEEYQRMSEAGYSAEGARLFLSLAKEWRDQTSNETASVEQELIKLENGWLDAEIKKDVAFLDRILADDITDTDGEGNILTKAQDLEEVKSGVLVRTSSVLDEMKVRVYGDAAVVTGRTTGKSQYKGKDVSGGRCESLSSGRGMTGFLKNSETPLGLYSYTLIPLIPLEQSRGSSKRWAIGEKNSPMRYQEIFLVILNPPTPFGESKGVAGQRIGKGRWAIQDLNL